MCLGEVRHVVIPPALAYGWGGSEVHHFCSIAHTGRQSLLLQGYVPPHATIYFVLELVHLKDSPFQVEVCLSLLMLLKTYLGVIS